jgi:hypothetical protein
MSQDFDQTTDLDELSKWVIFVFTTNITESLRIFVKKLVKCV